MSEGPISAGLISATGIYKVGTKSEK